MSAFKVTVMLSLILVTSVPSNYALISYLAEKPLGNQTVLDTIHSDLFTVNLLCQLVICGSCIVVALYGPLPSQVAKVLGWTSFFLVLSLLGVTASAFIMRYLCIFYLKDIEEFEDWLLTYMARATSTLPASLLTAHYMNSEIVNPFEAFLNTFQRTNNTNQLENFKTAFLYFLLIISLSTILLSYLNMKENIKLITPKPKEKVQMAIADMKTQDEIKGFHDELQKKIVSILIFDILLTSSLLSADYPMALDYHSFQFYLGAFYIGTVVPGWIICAHHEIFNFVLRRAQRIWPYCGFIQRLKTSQGPNRA